MGSGERRDYRRRLCQPMDGPPAARAVCGVRGGKCQVSSQRPNSKRFMITIPLLRIRLISLAVLACLSLTVLRAADLEQTIADLIPKLAAEKVEDRYGP